MNTMKSLPPLVGMKVCINPEKPNYNKYRKPTNNATVGYIANQCGLSKDLLKKWQANLRGGLENLYSTYYVSVMFENGKRCNINYGDLILIDEPCVDVMMYGFESGTVYVAGGLGKELLEEKLINNGERVCSSEIFDKKWRLERLEDTTDVDEYISRYVK